MARDAARPLAANHAFNFHQVPESRLRPGEIIVDLFAGGGGASEALRQALGRDPDIAINHDEWAVSMHAANHPMTKHMREDVFHADPVAEARGRRVGWLHASPDCTHFSQAKGGQPRSRAVRALSWVVVKWAGKLARCGLAPRIISLENVAEILKWCPLVAKRDKVTGRVIRLDGSVAAAGECTPLRDQFLVPDVRRLGETWSKFVTSLRALGYIVEWRKLRACDFGAGTSRMRLFMVARRDGAPCWPEPTHGPGRIPYVTAADCINWSIACPSIFTRKKPLADATMRRIARGIKKFVLDAAEPFIVPMTHTGGDRVHAASEPLRTVTSAHRGEFAACSPLLVPRYGERDGQLPRSLDVGMPMPTIVPDGNGASMVAASLVQASHGEGQGATKRRGDGAPDPRAPLGTIHAGGGSFAAATAHMVKIRGDSAGSAIDEPVPTITSGAGAARPAGCAHALGVMTAFIEQAAGGPNSNTSPPRGADEPVSTITQAGSQQRLVTANLAKLRGTSSAADVAESLHTISAGGEHHAVVECTLSPEVEASALRVAAFLIRYYGEGGQWGELREPADTITTKDRLALVTVHVRGVPYVIVDIGLRMLTPPELYRAQGFPRGYIFDRTADGRRISNTTAVRMVGNSVSPPPLLAIARANLDPVTELEQAA